MCITNVSLLYTVLQCLCLHKRAREVALERRCQDLLEECKSWQDKTSTAVADLESATSRLRSQDQQLRALAGTREGLEAQLRQARADAKKQVGTHQPPIELEGRFCPGNMCGDV
jgi:chromosome segregation ATPase